MGIPASRVFEYLQARCTGTILRHELRSPALSIYRRCLTKIALQLHDSDDQDAIDAAFAVRAVLSECLTVPISFDESLISSVTNLLGPSDSIERRFGASTFDVYM